MLKEVEHGKYYDSIRYIDRFETLLYYIEMSIGSKAPLAAEYYNDRIINFSECGENALRMLSYLNDGNVYLRSRLIELPWEIDHPIVCNGKKWERVSLLNRLIG